MEEQKYPKIFKKSGKINGSILLGGNMVLDNAFDIKKYLPEIKNQFETENKLKINLMKSSLLNNNFKKKINEETININDTKKQIYTPKRIIRIKRSYDLTKNKEPLSPKIFHIFNSNNTTLINNEMENPYMSSSNRNISYKEKIPLINTIRQSPLKTEENINISKLIKSIRKNTELSRQKRSTEKIMKNNLAYEQKHEDVVFDSVNILNDYNTKKERKLKKDEAVSYFLYGNKKVALDNVMIKLLDKEKNKMYAMEEKREKNLEEYIKSLDSDEQNFEKFITLQKTASKSIEGYLSELVSVNRRMIEKERNWKAQLKTSEDERQRLLERIDEFRVFGKFVNRVLDRNTGIFENKIIPEYKDDGFPDFDDISIKVIENYGNLIDKNNLEEKKDIFDLPEPDILYHKFIELQDNIIRELKKINSRKSEISNIINQNDLNINELRKRSISLEKEYENLKNIYEIENEELKDIQNRTGSIRNQYDELIQDLYYEIIKIFSLGDKKNRNNNLLFVNALGYKFIKDNDKNLKLNVRECSKEMQKIIVKNESKLYELQYLLEQYEKEDQNLFTQIVNDRKLYNKYEKQSELKKMAENIQNQRKAKASDTSNKVIFISRKCEPPFYVPKKLEKEKIDPEILKQKENEKLLTYN